MRAKKKIPKDRILCADGPHMGLTISDKYGPRTPWDVRGHPEGHYIYEGTATEGVYRWRLRAA